MKNTAFKLISMMLSLIMLVSLVSSLSACSGDGDDIQSSEESSAATDAPVRKILEADLSKYTLIRPTKTSDDLLEEIGLLRQKITAVAALADYRDDFYRNDVPALAMSEFEILVGKTNRSETAQFLSDLKYNDFGFALIGNKIVIAGHSEQGTMNALKEFASAVINNKNKEDGVFYSSEYDFQKRLEYAVNDIVINDVSLSDYHIVYASRNSYSEKTAAEKIANKIAAVSGIVVEVMSDVEDNGVFEYEILVGNTNRHSESEIAEISGKLSGTNALVKYDGKKLALFGSTSTAIFVAASEVTDKILSDKTEKLSLSFESEKLCEYDDSILTAMSFNVWVSGRTEERNKRVLEMVKKYLPDTIGFQEVNSIWLAVLNSGLRDQYAFVGEGRDGGANGEYNPIFYKKDVFDLIESGTKWLSDTPDKVSKVEESSLNRIYTYALLEKKSDGKRILVVNTHFEHTSAAAREKQAAVLVEYIKKNTDYPVVLTGDFNCDNSTKAYSAVISSGVKNSYDIADKKLNKDATFTNYGASNKIIDFAFVTPDKISVVSYRVCSEKINGDYPSDHHPVLIEYAVLN